MSPGATWMVVEPLIHNAMQPVSLHTTQEEAEMERDRRNKNLERPRFSACIAIEPTAERMGCSLRHG